jgi:hypothetical protein
MHSATPFFQQQIQKCCDAFPLHPPVTPETGSVRDARTKQRVFVLINYKPSKTFVNYLRCRQQRSFAIA